MMKQIKIDLIRRVFSYSCTTTTTTPRKSIPITFKHLLPIQKTTIFNPIYSPGLSSIKHLTQSSFISIPKCPHHHHFYTQKIEPKENPNKPNETTNQKGKESEEREGDEKRKVQRRENIYTLPNIVTCSRILLCPLLSYTILNDFHFISNFILIYCGFSDYIDGKLARMYPDSMASVLGSILDPAADKILMSTLVISLSCKSLLPLPLAFIILGRDALLSLSSLYFRYQSLPLPKTFARFWDLSLPSAEVKPTLISKYNTFLQLMLVGLTMITPIIPIDTSTPLLFLQWIVAISTISSGLSYVFLSKNVITYIR